MYMVVLISKLQYYQDTCTDIDWTIIVFEEVRRNYSRRKDTSVNTKHE